MQPATIKYKLDRKNLTQTAVARMLGISVSGLNKIIHGNTSNESVMRQIRQIIDGSFDSANTPLDGSEDESNCQAGGGDEA